MKNENKIFKILCVLSLITMILSIFFMNKCNAQTFVDTTQQNKNVIVEEFTGIGCVFCPAGHLIGQTLHDNNPNDVFLINIHTGSYASPQGAGTDFRTNFGSSIAGQSNLIRLSCRYSK